MGLMDLFSQLANSIREKSGSSDRFTPLQMANYVNNIISEADLSLTVLDSEDMQYKPNHELVSLQLISNSAAGSSFNSPVKIGKGVRSAANLFNGFATFNQPVDIPPNCTNTFAMFNRCSQLDSPINIHDGVTNCANMFYYASNFNQPINIPANLVNSTYMFGYASNFNQPINIPANLVNATCMFAFCYGFNSPVTISARDTELQATSMFYGCTNLNQPITILTYNINMSSMFGNCFTFNQPIQIPNGVRSTINTFIGAKNFNQPINIPSTTNNAYQMFAGCYNFNSPVTFEGGNEVQINLCNLFDGCSNFNQPFNFPGNITGAMGVFSNCVNFNAPVYIPGGATIYMPTLVPPFRNCGSYNSTITFGAGEHNSQDVMYIAYNSGIIGSIVFEDGAYAGTNTVAYAMYGNMPNYTGDISFLNGTTNITTGVFNCGSFNGNVIIPDSVNYIRGLVSNCQQFNHPITIPDGVDTIYNVVYNCRSFNQPISIACNNLTSASVIYTCMNFNAPITFDCPNLRNIEGLIGWCPSFNQPVTIPDTITSMNNAFRNCAIFNCDIEIPESCNYYHNFLNSCNNYRANVTIRTNVFNNTWLPTSGTSTTTYNINYSLIFNSNRNIFNLCFSGWTGLRSGRIVFDLNTSDGVNLASFAKGAANFRGIVEFGDNFVVNNMYMAFNGSNCFNNATNPVLNFPRLNATVVQGVQYMFPDYTIFSTINMTRVNCRYNTTAYNMFSSKAGIMRNANIILGEDFTCGVYLLTGGTSRTAPAFYTGNIYIKATSFTTSSLQGTATAAPIGNGFFSMITLNATTIAAGPKNIYLNGHLANFCSSNMFGSQFDIVNAQYDSVGSYDDSTARFYPAANLYVYNFIPAGI